MEKLENNADQSDANKSNSERRYDMTIKLNSYSLPEDVVEKMRLKIEETRQKKIELGFGLCRMKYVNTLKSGSECSGNECSVLPIQECQTGTYVGGYHTHPSGTAEPSIADLRNAYINDVECVGSVKEDAIRCFIRNGNKKPQDEKGIISIVKEIEEPLPTILNEEQHKIWKSARDEILNKHFQTVDIR